MSEALPYLVAGVLRRLAMRDDDTSIEDEMIVIADELVYGVLVRSKGEAGVLTYAQLLSGQFVGDENEQD